MASKVKLCAGGAKKQRVPLESSRKTGDAAFAPAITVHGLHQTTRRRTAQFALHRNVDDSVNNDTLIVHG